MLISYRNKFIFIHVYKVAGTSVSVALNDYCLNNPIPCAGINKLIEPFVTGRRLSNRFSNIVQRALSGNLTGNIFTVYSNLFKSLYIDFLVVRYIK